MAYLASWLVLAGVQAVIVPTLTEEVSGGVSSLGAGLIAVMLGLQVLKVPVTIRRLADAGRPPDDALWTLVPLLNVALWFQLLSAGLAEPERRRRIRSWATQTTAFGAYAQALSWIRPTVGLGLGVAVAGAALVGVGGDLFVDAVLGADDGLRGRVAEAAAVLAGLLGLYTFVQFLKQRTVSRASWLPSLLLVPALLLTASLSLGSAAAQGMGAMVVVLIDMAWMLSVGALAGGAASAVWILAADLGRSGEPPATGGVLGAARQVLGDTMVAYGARMQIVQIGAQVVIPGIWYAVSFAFSDVIAAVDPARPVFKGSSQLARGVRGKLFKILTLGFVGSLVSMLVVYLPFLGAEEIAAAMFDPTVVPTHVVFLEQLVWWLWGWWTTVAMLVLFRERDALLQAKLAREAGAGVEGTPS